ncbi:metalloregulator ArsR/SmtB family transcription factor [Variovorax rhizosphaerae]|uniref:Metalloregulator ArsR/SmtB family transcription factor n=1 Tax=Variovorax rhizosphaerae TaxID=1836200 RepID=A0ABU8WL67_9BURK
MVQLSDPNLDLVFTALADRTRRDVLVALGQRDLSISELAQPHGMSLTGFMKHLRVLEAAGLIARSKEGRVVRCELSAAPLQEAAVWLSRYEKFWNARFDALGRYLQHQEEVKPCPTSTPSTKPPPANAPNSASNATSPSRRKKSGARGPTRKP